jgi:hypothetical protein
MFPLLILLFASRNDGGFWGGLPIRSEVLSRADVCSFWTSNGASNCAEKEKGWPI